MDVAFWVLVGIGSFVAWALITTLVATIAGRLHLNEDLASYIIFFWPVSIAVLPLSPAFLVLVLAMGRYGKIRQG